MLRPFLSINLVKVEEIRLRTKLNDGAYTITTAIYATFLNNGVQGTTQGSENKLSKMHATRPCVTM